MVSIVSSLRQLSVFLLVSLVVAQSAAIAQESSASLARKLENQMLAGKGVQMKFNLAGEGNVTVSTDILAKRVRLESGKLLIISDGSTIWNYDKVARRVTIDNISATGSAFKDPVALFRFAEHYTSRIISSNGKSYTLELTPDAQLQALLKGSGNIQSLTLNLTNGKSIKITKANVTSARGQSHTSAISIKSLKTIKASDFVFRTAGDMKVIDLRE